MTVALSPGDTESLYWAQTVYDDLKTGELVAGSVFVNPTTKLSRRCPTHQLALSLLDSRVNLTETIGLELRFKFI